MFIEHAISLAIPRQKSSGHRPYCRGSLDEPRQRMATFCCGRMSEIRKPRRSPQGNRSHRDVDSRQYGQACCPLLVLFTSHWR